MIKVSGQQNKQSYQHRHSISLLKCCSTNTVYFSHKGLLQNCNMQSQWQEETHIVLLPACLQCYENGVQSWAALLVWKTDHLFVYSQSLSPLWDVLIVITPTDALHRLNMSFQHILIATLYWRCLKHTSAFNSSCSYVVINKLFLPSSTSNIACAIL